MRRTTELRLIPISSLQRHPDNPRVLIREDVVSAIAANLDGEYPQKHALSVRTMGDAFQILSGHHRVEAARRKSMEAVWCWIEDLDDEAAFMELATSNSQGELSPLEIGIHALKAVPPEKGGRGKKGGLSAYADRIGKDKGNVSRYRDAGEVYEAIKNRCNNTTVFLDKAQHLAAIHKLPPECWSSACDWLSTSAEPVSSVEERVTAALVYFNSKRDSAYLPQIDCTSAVFQGPAIAATFQRLADIQEKVHQELEGYPDLQAEWDEWLITSRPLSWDIKAVQSKRIEFEEIVWERENKATASAEEISVLLADPPWQYDFAETSNRQIENQYPSASLEEICSHSESPWFPPLADNAVLYLWATAPKLLEALRVLDAWGFTYKTHAVWDKKKIGMGYWFRGQHELLLVGTRGVMSPPEQSDRQSSILSEERQGHSIKPECAYLMIEGQFPDAIKGEVYARKERQGWKAFRLGGADA